MKFTKLYWKQMLEVKMEELISAPHREFRHYRREWYLRGQIEMIKIVLADYDEEPVPLLMSKETWLAMVKEATNESE